MKIILSNKNRKRSGQITLGIGLLIGAAILTAIVGYVGYSGYQSAKKSIEAKQAADAKAFSDQTQSELNAGGKNAVASPACNSASADYPNCLTAPQYLPSQTDLNAKVQGGFLNSIGNTLLPIAESLKAVAVSIEDGIVYAYRGISNFLTLLPSAPINQTSTAPAPALTLPVSVKPTTTRHDSSTSATNSGPIAQPAPQDTITNAMLTSETENSKLFSTLAALVTPNASFNARYAASDIIKDLRARDVKITSSSEILDPEVTPPASLLCLKSGSGISEQYSGNCAAESFTFKMAKSINGCKINLSVNVIQNSGSFALGLLSPADIVGSNSNCNLGSADFDLPSFTVSPGNTQNSSLASLVVRYKFPSSEARFFTDNAYEGTLNLKLNIGPMRNLTNTEKNLVLNRFAY